MSSQQSLKGTLRTGSFFLDLWISIKAMPLWVQVWMFLILVPINCASLLFISGELGGWVTFLAYIGMLMNIPVIIYDRGVSRLMSVPHLIPWTALLVLIWNMDLSMDSSYGIFLWSLFTINAISLAFDYPDSYKWFKGQRDVLGFEAD